MIKAFLITDTRSFPYYSRSVNDYKTMDINLFSGLICSIGSIGKELFNKKLATIHFGGKAAQNHLIVVTKTFFSQKRTIYFAFFIEGECDQTLVREISATIFIETKHFLKFKEEEVDIHSFRTEVDRIIERKYGNLTFCV